MANLNESAKFYSSLKIEVKRFFFLVNVGVLQTLRDINFDCLRAPAFKKSEKKKID